MAARRGKERHELSERVKLALAASCDTCSPSRIASPTSV